MLGIGFYPFILLPWVIVGPMVWAIVAANLWQKHPLWARCAACIASASVAVPLVASLRSGEDAGVACLVTAVLSFIGFSAYAVGCFFWIVLSWIRATLTVQARKD